MKNSRSRLSRYWGWAMSMRVLVRFPIVPDAYRELGLVTMPPKYLTPSAQKMIQHIQQYAIENGL